MPPAPLSRPPGPAALARRLSALMVSAMIDEVLPPEDKYLVSMHGDNSREITAIPAIVPGAALIFSQRVIYATLQDITFHLPISSVLTKK